MIERDRLLMSYAAAFARLEAIKAICDAETPDKDGSFDAISDIVLSPLLIPGLPDKEG